MRNTFTHKRGAARFDFEIAPGRQVIVRVSGPVTPAVMAALAKDGERVALGVRAKSFVLNYERAAMALTYEQLLQMPYKVAEPLRVLPIAIVPPPALCEMYREFAWAMAKLGLVRGIFREDGPALEWAHRQQSSALVQYCRAREPVVPLHMPPVASRPEACRTIVPAPVLAHSRQSMRGVDLVAGREAA